LSYGRAFCEHLRKDRSREGQRGAGTPAVNLGPSQANADFA